MRKVHSIYAAKKNLIKKDVLSEFHSKVLIGHFSDIHGDIKRFENAIAYFEYSGADFAVHTGGTLTWNMSDDYDFLLMVQGNPRFLYTIA